jgi:hypothetical protein
MECRNDFYKMAQRKQIMNLIFKAIVGSQSYGTAIPTSDIDMKGVYVQNPEEILGFGYKEQVDVGKDECYYEVKRFIQLLTSANPTVLELLYSPEDCVVEKHPVFDLLVTHRDKFLTKKCLQSFGGYAVQQISKAKGLDKKMNWEKERVERKNVLDFCYVLDPASSFATFPLKTWLKKEKKDQKHCGLVVLPHFRQSYALFYDHIEEMKSENARFEGKGYGFKGVVQDEEISNDVSLSSVPEYANRETVLFFNKDAYSIHCKDYRKYQEWLQKRNTTRYVDSKTHGQKIDGKNMLHCRRLLDMAKEIATAGTITVRRPNRDYLLQIRRGEVNLEELITQAEADVKELDALFAASSLPDEVDPAFAQELLIDIRKRYKASLQSAF